MKYFPLVLALMGAPVIAAEPAGVSVIVHGVSRHFKNTTDDGMRYNERNTGFGLRIAPGDDWALQAGVYENSYSTPDVPRRSNYASVDWAPLDWAPLDWGHGVSAGAFIGIVDGYPSLNDGRPILAGGALIRAQMSRFSAAIRVVPGQKGHGVVSLEFGVRL